MGKCKLLGGGGAMGRYVWRKSEIVPAVYKTFNYPYVKLTYIGYENRLHTVQITAGNFDIAEALEYEDDLYTFLMGFEKNDNWYFGTDSTYADYMVLNGAMYTLKSLSYKPTDGTAYAYFSTVPGTITSIDGTYLYSGIKRYLISEESYSPLKFVVSDKSGQYPTKGKQNGYYYELIGSIESTQALSLSTLSADTMRDISVDEIQKGVTDGIL